MKALLLLAALAAAEPSAPLSVSFDRPDWTYAVGEPARCVIAASDPAAAISYSIGPEGLAPRAQGRGRGKLDVEAGTMSEPGFLRCEATLISGGKTHRGLATAAFSPDAIKPSAEEPADFDAFWRDGKSELAKLPLDAKLSPPRPGDVPGVDCFDVSVQNVGPSRLFGVLCEPAAAGKYPALLEVPGAGVRGYRGRADLAAKGMITLQIGIHGLPVDLKPSVYRALKAGALADYFYSGIGDPRRYYYRRVILGCLRAGDFLASRPKWDGKTLLVEGESQGGALSLATAALDPRVTALAALFPALSDLTGYLHGRAGGWPRLFAPDSDVRPTKENVATTGYYDAVNFARRVKAPGFYSWGFNDELCPPTSMFAAYNVITAPKTLLIDKEQAHERSLKQTAARDAWLQNQMGVRP